MERENESREYLTCSITDKYIDIYIWKIKKQVSFGNFLRDIRTFTRQLFLYIANCAVTVVSTTFYVRVNEIMAFRDAIKEKEAWRF